jgi:hypothetical protein
MMMMMMMMMIMITLLLAAAGFAIAASEAGVSRGQLYLQGQRVAGNGLDEYCFCSILQQQGRAAVGRHAAGRVDG